MRKTLESLWTKAGPPILQVTGEGMFTLGVILETAGVFLQRKGLDLLEVRAQMLEAQASRQERRRRFEALRNYRPSAYVP